MLRRPMACSGQRAPARPPHASQAAGTTEPPHAGAIVCATPDQASATQRGSLIPRRGQREARQTRSRRVAHTRRPSETFPRTICIDAAWFHVANVVRQPHSPVVKPVYAKPWRPDRDYPEFSSGVRNRKDSAVNTHSLGRTRRRAAPTMAYAASKVCTLTPFPLAFPWLTTHPGSRILAHRPPPLIAHPR